MQCRLAAAAQRVRRRPEDITLVGVTKLIGLERIQPALAAGLRHLGENYVQEALDKYEVIGDRAIWHFIGHLQRNKVRYVVPRFDLIETVDSLRLAQEIDKRATQVGKRMPVLLQVNVGDEDSKFGVAPSELGALWDQVAALAHLEVQGLMAIPPLAPEPEQSRPYFRRLREMAEELEASAPGPRVRHLSMGMTQDFEVAIEEGATIVRVGTGIFGPRE